MTALVLAAFALATAAVGFGWGSDFATVAVADLSAVVAAVLATVAVLRIRRRSSSGSSRGGWTALGIALGLWSLGEVLWTTWEVVLDREVPYPSIADIAYLGAVPFAVAALIRFVPARGARVGVRRVLDGCLIALSTLFVGWALALGPAMRGDGETFLSHVVTVSYPLTDVVLVVLAVVVLQSAGTGARRPLQLVAAGFALMAVADTAYTWMVAQGTYSGQGLVTMLWPASYLLVAAAARTEGRGDHAGSPSERVSLLLPYVPLAAAAAVAAPRVVAGERLGPFLAVIGTVILALVLARQALTAWDLRATVAVLADREAELARLALTDPLTGLPNRARFGEALEAAVAAPGVERPAVLYIDLDGFKAVNDRFGHDMGDRLLVDAAERLLRAAGMGNVVARLGGDEFVVLVPAGHAAAVLLAQRVLDSFVEPFAVEGAVIRFQASVGVASAPPGASPDEAVRRADAAMYVAKATGKGRAVDYPDETIVTASRFRG